MEVWLPRASSNSAVLGTDDREIWSRFHLAWGKSLSENWLPVTAYVGRGKPSHFVFLGSGNLLTCNDEAWQRIGDVIGHDVEDLPVTVGTAVYHILNVVSVLDCLDQEKSRVLRFPDSDIFIPPQILRSVFLESALRGHYLFRIKDAPEDVYATSDFKQLVEQQGLKHIEFYRPPSISIVGELSS